MANVKTVMDKGDKAAILHMDDGTQVWTPDREVALTLIGKPIPSDWTQKQGEYGPQAFPPRKGGGGGGNTAWRNTKEGFAAEQAGRQRWQEVEEERRDRRTALMQAVELATAFIAQDKDATFDGAGTAIAQSAETFYAWLRKSPAPTVDLLPAGAGGQVSTEGEAVGEGPGGDLILSSSPGPPNYPVPPGDCDHRSVSGTLLRLNSEGRCPRCGLVRGRTE